MNLDQKGTAVAEDKRQEFAELFEEFAVVYPDSPGGQEHVRSYEPAREQGRRNYDEVIAAVDRGDDVTEQVILRLLPYGDSGSTREIGAWIHVGPVFTTDARIKFEGAGWAEREDWPQITHAILQFVRRSSDNPRHLEASCEEFIASPYSKGFQSGTLTPILNALRPDDFMLINQKPLRAINYFADTSYSQRLADYPVVNALGHEVIRELTDLMHSVDVPQIRDDDLFDMFAHWLVAEKKFAFRTPRYWKVAPGEGAWNWDACREGGFIAVGWDELGDVSGLTRAEFNSRRDELVAKHDDWTKTGIEQVWTLSHIVKEGDRIVANRGTTELLGIGTVAGPYYFVEDIDHGHRLPVDWEDLTRRRVDEYGWRRTIVELDRMKFDSVSRAVPVPTDLAEPFSRIFEDRDQADWALQLLAETLERLGAEDSHDERFSITLTPDERRIRLDFGKWAILQFCAPGHPDDRLGLALLDDLADIETEREPSEPFADATPSISFYYMPIELARPLEGDLRRAYERTMATISERFRHWEGSPYRAANQSQIAEAVFDPVKRTMLLAQGLSPIEREGAYFTRRAFDLLAQLNDHPTHEFYDANKDALREHVIDPTKELLFAVRDRLAPAILDVMETEKRVFASILKQFAAQGCWDYYWGAFYPKGGKRTQDAQLFLWINRNRLDFGFYIGQYGSGQRGRFLRNCQENQGVLASVLRDNLADQSISFGEIPDDRVADEIPGSAQRPASLEDWLADPSRAGIRAAATLAREQVLQLSLPALADRIADIHQRVFPLVLLATLDDPMPAIGDYLQRDEVPPVNPHYSLAECARDTHFDLEDLATWVRAIHRKGQAIVYGPPGTGKTYVAEHLARHLIAGGDGFYDVVQFHPAYAYEDFVQGIRPKRKGDGQLDYPLLRGRFLDFCDKAKQCEDLCVLIIDEINRANLARVFGELMYLLEYRNREVPLAAGGSLRIPPNVRIIGTMNTADRSIALVDHALRRRFAFLALYPNYNILRRYHEATGFDVEHLINVLKKLNTQIGDRHYEVGITFFLRQDVEQQIEDIWAMEIEPYLEEYFFDQPDKVDDFRWRKVGTDILG